MLAEGLEVMASISPVTDRSVAGFVEPHRGLYGGANAVNAAMITNGTSLLNRNYLQLSIYRFSALGDTDTWDSSSTLQPPKGSLAVAWQPDQANTGIAAATIITLGTRYTDASIQFERVTAATGWLWVLHTT